MISRPLTVQEIVKRCGGPSVLEEFSPGDLTHWAVYKWYKNGIPEDRWELVMRLSGVSVTDVYEANLALRQAAGGPESSADEAQADEDVEQDDGGQFPQGELMLQAAE
jgi:hypothetical protein